MAVTSSHFQAVGLTCTMAKKKNAAKTERKRGEMFVVVDDPF
jgi:hypothetical protein